jgi:hypothetical protein
MIVKRLDVTRYTKGGWSNRTTTVNPAWPKIEKAIRRLDKFSYPFLWLNLSEANDSEEPRAQGACEYGLLPQDASTRRTYAPLRCIPTRC